MKKKICFVILHYMALEVTKECVDSIIKLQNGHFIEIVIVDNGSTNKTGKKLKTMYEQNKRVHIILLENNSGFANGNNVGYEYAKKILQVDFIVIANSDTCFLQKNFIETIYKIYNEINFSVLGPDIINTEGIHQNPYRKKALSRNEVTRLLINKKVMYWFMMLQKRYPILGRYNLPWKLYIKKGNRDRKVPDKQLENVVLHGSCIILSPIFLENNEQVFYLNTFMYGEEDILGYVCKIRNYRIVYSSQLQVIHKEEKSTKFYYIDEIERNLFRLVHGIDSCRKLRNYMQIHDKKFRLL